jgi:hypothetical protein
VCVCVCMCVCVCGVVPCNYSRKTNKQVPFDTPNHNSRFMRPCEEATWMFYNFWSDMELTMMRSRVRARVSALIILQSTASLSITPLLNTCMILEPSILAPSFDSRPLFDWGRPRVVL